MTLIAFWSLQNEPLSVAISTPLLTYLFSVELPPLLDLSPEPLLPPLAFSAISLALSIRPDMFAEYDGLGGYCSFSVECDVVLLFELLRKEIVLVKLYPIVEQRRHWDHMQAT